MTAPHPAPGPAGGDVDPTFRVEIQTGPHKATVPGCELLTRGEAIGRAEAVVDRGVGPCTLRVVNERTGFCADEIVVMPKGGLYD
jgi:hypothetical protein